MVNIPEDIVLEILYRLPVKSLFRFTCVSKKWCFSILYDSKFARSHFKTSLEQQTRGCCRLLLYDREKLTSSELETPLFGDDSTIRKLCCPFKQRCGIYLLCSGNGLVCAVNYENDDENFYIWNPSTGFFKQIPDSRVSSKPGDIIYHGCGYLSATNDFKFLIAGIEKNSKEKEKLLEIFSWRSQVWKTIEVIPGKFNQGNGILLNEALHWLSMSGNILFAFDLLEEEFRRLPLPILEKDDEFFDGVTVSAGKCLCLYRFLDGTYCHKHFAEYNCSIDLWVMREYDRGESWIKLCRLKFSSIPSLWTLKPLLVMKDSTLVGKWTRRCINNFQGEAVRVGYDGVVFEKNVLDDGGCQSLEIEESLLRLDDYDVVEQVKTKRLKTQH